MPSPSSSPPPPDPRLPRTWQNQSPVARPHLTPVNGYRFTRTEVLDRRSVIDAFRDATKVVAAFGFEDVGQVWQRSWPVAIDAVLGGCEAAGARLVFFDNLYMYGPQAGPLHEDLALTTTGRKPSMRAAITRQWRAAHDRGRVRVVALRASDFYGCGVQASHIGNDVIRAIAAGKPAAFVAPLDVPHDFAYVPDIHGAVMSMLDAPDDAFGQAWHVRLGNRSRSRSCHFGHFHCWASSSRSCGKWQRCGSNGTIRTGPIRHVSPSGSGVMSHRSMTVSARPSRPTWHPVHDEGGRHRRRFAANVTPRGLL